MVEVMDVGGIQHPIQWRRWRSSLLLGGTSALVTVTVLNREYQWVASRDLEISPERLLDVVALVFAVATIYALRAQHRTTGDANYVTAASTVLMAAVGLLVGMGESVVSEAVLQWIYIAAGIAIATLATATMFNCRTPDSFASHIVLAGGVFAASGVLVAIGVAALDPDPSSMAAAASVAVVASLSGIALTVIGLRKDDVGRQILGLLVLSAATLGTHLPGASSNDAAVLIHKATFAGLLGTLVVHAVVDLRNRTEVAQSTMERTVADLDFSKTLLQEQREERARLVHDARNALLVIQAGLRSVAGDDSEELVASMFSELNRIQAMIERNHAPVEPLDVLETLAPMIQCYESGGIPIVVHSSTSGPIALASRTQLVEVMQNLIENAIRHANAERPIEVTVRTVENLVQIEVRDYGVGIDLRDRLRVAERVFSQSGLGTGRGLSICQRLMQEMNGELDYYLPPHGSGSVFRLRLPAVNHIDQQAVAS